MSGQPGGLELVAAQLRDISTTVGFFYLKGHGIPQELIDRTFAESRRFHALPIETKMKMPYFTTIHGFKSGYQPCFGDGYQNMNVNIVSDAKPNLVAKYAINREGGSGGLSMTPEERQATVNRWPENLPGFKETLLEYQGSIETLGRKFLPLWAASLNLPLDYFEKYFATPHVTLNILYYPPQDHVGDRQYGIAPHTDNALMTFISTVTLKNVTSRFAMEKIKSVTALPVPALA